MIRAEHKGNVYEIKRIETPTGEHEAFLSTGPRGFELAFTVKFYLTGNDDITPMAWITAKGKANGIPIHANRMRVERRDHSYANIIWRNAGYLTGFVRDPEKIFGQPVTETATAICYKILTEALEATYKDHLKSAEIDLIQSKLQSARDEIKRLDEQISEHDRKIAELEQMLQGLQD